MFIYILKTYVYRDFSGYKFLDSLGKDQKEWQPRLYAMIVFSFIKHYQAIFQNSCII